MMELIMLAVGVMVGTIWMVNYTKKFEDFAEELEEELEL